MDIKREAGIGSSRDSGFSSDLPAIRIKHEPIDNYGEENGMNIVDDLRSRLAEAERKLKLAEEERDVAEVQSQTWMEQCADSERRRISAEKKAAKERQGASSRIDELEQKDNAAVTTWFNKYKAELVKSCQSDRRADEAADEVKRLREEMERLRVSIASSDGEMQKRLTESERRRRDAEEQLVQVAPIMNGLRSDLEEAKTTRRAELDKQKEKLSDKLRDVEKKCDKLEKDKKELHEKLKRAERSIATEKAEAKIANEQLDKDRQELRSLRKRNRKRITSGHDDASKDHPKTEKKNEMKVEELREALRRSEKKFNQLQGVADLGGKKYTSLQAEFERTSESLVKASKERCEKWKECEDLKAKCAELETEVAGSRGRTMIQERNEKEWMEMKEQIKKMEEKRVESESEAANQQAKLKVAEADLEELRRVNAFLVTTKSGELLEELMETRKRIIVLEGELESARSKPVVEEVVKNGEKKMEESRKRAINEKKEEEEKGEEGEADLVSADCPPEFDPATSSFKWKRGRFQAVKVSPVKSGGKTPSTPAYSSPLSSLSSTSVASSSSTSIASTSSTPRFVPTTLRITNLQNKNSTFH
ncbi:hypothetical protein PFISCL1PPCAC_6881 [Pristionchus fissidentatus]|uniref:Uncharacterized protein n=1 Tax=Pristionchus fissidentatus TaxID=1538716 RepID=A0AAV5VAR2_9BILA|nr:hypothetical protein PFISCL1PPCAC_6881 [Pristionchus fissidentatus]